MYFFRVANRELHSQEERAMFARVRELRKRVDGTRVERRVGEGLADRVLRAEHYRQRRARVAVAHHFAVRRECPLRVRLEPLAL